MVLLCLSVNISSNEIYYHVNYHVLFVLFCYNLMFKDLFCIVMAFRVKNNFCFFFYSFCNVKM